MFLSIASTFLKFLNKYNQSEILVEKFSDCNKADYNKNLQFAKIREKNFCKINNRIIFNNNKITKKFEYINNEEWNKLSLGEKLKKRFIFKDSRQFPYKNVWKKLSKKEKEDFLAERKKWRANYMAEL